VLHVLNGDATATVFARAGIPGDTLVWRDILCEGPAISGLDAAARRAAYLAAHLDIDAGEYVRAWQAEHAALAGVGGHDEVVLWFEQDLFCAVNLWYLLTRVGGIAAASLVYPSLDDVRGLGAAAPEQLASLFAARRRLTSDAVESGRAAWQAYAAASPAPAQAGIRAGDGSLPFVAAALERHLARLPALVTGLNEIEEAALQEADGAGRPFPALFAAVTAREPLRRHGMGDVQLAATLRALAGGDPPLVTIDGGRALAECRHWYVRLTSGARAALKGERPWRPPVRSIGGLQVDGAGATWRRDGDDIRTVA
jgi:hypothetical protein